MADSSKDSKAYPIAFNGRWRPALDGTQLAEGDFQTLTNMRYTDAPGIKPVLGMTKINTTATTYTGIKTGFHFRKESPVAETHVLVQAQSGTAGKIYDNTTAIPSAGDFSATAVFTETASASTGCFSDAPGGRVAYTNAKETCIWGGTEDRLGAFFIGDSSNILTSNYDYTDRVNNDINSAAESATMVLSSGSAYVYIGVLRPLQGIKFYVRTANTATATATVKYWDGSAWAAVSGASDGTSSGGKTLAQTGTISFTSTTSTAKTRVMGNVFLYWYQVTFASVDATTVVYQCTVDAPFQSLVDIWDGTPRGIASFIFVSNGADETTRVFAQDFNAADTTTYSNISSLVTTTSFYVGFFNRMTALKFGIAPSYGNSTANTMTIKYWNGATWATVGTLVDQTLDSGSTKTLSKAGWVSWNAPASTLEFPTSMNGGPFLYYYYIQFSGTLSSSVYLDYIFGIPVQKTMYPYYKVGMWQNRMVLVGEVNARKNCILIGSYGGTATFNGNDVLEVPDIGDNSPPTAVGALSSRYTGAFYDTLLILKKNEVWVLDGTTITDYRLYRLSDKYGCVAPQTFQTLPVSYEVADGINRNIAIWQTATGIVAFDGNTISPIDADIRNYFDPADSTCITAAYIDQSIAWVDEREREYHYCFASGSGATSLNTEIAYSTKRKGWFKVTRGVTLQCGFTVTDTYGGRYTYGATSAGYVERLEYGTTFDGTAIACTVKTRDFPLPPVGWAGETGIRGVDLIQVAKTTSGRVTITHYGDTCTTASSGTITCNPNSSTNRVVTTNQSVNWRSFTFHCLNLAFSASDANLAFIPIGIVIYYKDFRQNT